VGWYIFYSLYQIVKVHHLCFNVSSYLAAHIVTNGLVQELGG
jgi:hypothetical protein